MKRDPIVQAFSRLARRRPASPLVVSPEHRVTVGELDALARAAGLALAEGAGARGSRRRSGDRTEPEAMAGLAACNGPGLLAGLLALRRAGFAALLLDGHSPEPESLRVVRSLGARGLLRCRAAWPRGPADFTWVDLPASAGNGEGPLFVPPGCAVVKLTSGSTGEPRGIAAPAESLLADDAALTSSMGIGPGDRLLAAIPFAHSYGLSSLVLPALVRGTPLVLPDESGLLGPFAAAERMEATVFPTAPAWLDALVRLPQVPAWPRSLRLVITAGAPLGVRTAGSFRERFGLPVHVFYGASECGGICYDREGGAGERGSVGTPIDGVSVRLQPVRTAQAGEGEEGIVLVSSPAVADSYLPESDERLRPGCFMTGDLAAWSGGELVLRGRRDGFINIKGKKVHPREVEAVLEQLQGVEEVAVLGVPVPERGSEVLRAVIACQPGRLSPAEVLAWCRTHLAAHKVPRSLILVPRMPRTARGKLDRSALLALRGGSGPGLAG
jgi:acyl-coenzyme A synthetase/AMP-(fatty) acid ligase